MQKKRKTPTELLQLRMLNTVSRANACSQKKSTKVSTKKIMWTFPTKGELDQTTFYWLKNRKEVLKLSFEK